MLNNNLYFDPIASFSNDQYYNLDSYLIHPQYLSPPPTHHHQSLCFHSVYIQSDPFDDIDQEHQIHLLLQNHLHSHDNINNNLQQHHQHSKPSYMRESADEITRAVPVLPESASPYNPTITTSGNLMKGKSPAPNHDDHHQQQLLISSENLGGKKPVPPADHHHHHLYVEPQNMPRKRGSSSGVGSSSNGKNKKRKDRHSKILIRATTRPRHRRMRLSIDVAREFFDLQDMLGVERASKTVEWLLIKAKPDIDKLRELNNRGSYSISTSTSSGLDEEGMNGSEKAAGSGTSSKPAGIKEKKKKYTRSKSSKRVVINPLAKEKRKRARERARERTREKMINNKRVEMRINNNINLSSSSRDQSVLHLVSSCYHEHDHHHHRHQHYDDQFAQEPSLIVANTNGWNNLQASTSTSAAFLDDESCNSNLVNNIHEMGGNLWNPSLVATNSLNNVVSAAATTTSATAAFGIPQQHQFSFFGNGWEGCNSQSLGFPET